jgi:hypothetical protein
MDIRLPDEYPVNSLLKAFVGAANEYNIKYKNESKRFTIEKNPSYDVIGYDLRKGVPELEKKLIRTTVHLRLERIKKTFPITLKSTDAQPSEAWEEDDLRIDCNFPSDGSYNTISLDNGLTSQNASPVLIRYFHRRGKIYPGNAEFELFGKELFEKFLQLFIDFLAKTKEKNIGWDNK